MDALNGVGQGGLATFVNWAGLAGLSRELLQLDVCGFAPGFRIIPVGYLPNVLALTGLNVRPLVALAIQMVLGRIGGGYA